MTKICQQAIVIISSDLTHILHPYVWPLGKRVAVAFGTSYGTADGCRCRQVRQGCASGLSLSPCFCPSSLTFRLLSTSSVPALRILMSAPSPWLLVLRTYSLFNLFPVSLSSCYLDHARSISDHACCNIPLQGLGGAARHPRRQC